MNEYKIGIVGGTGFIGSSLARYMNKRFRVKILDVKEPTEDLCNAEFRQCNIRIYEEVKKGIQDLDLVIHTAIIQMLHACKRGSSIESHLHHFVILKN